MKHLFYSPVDPSQLKKEKRKARELRKTQWWKLKLSGGICHYCEGSFPKKELTMDHIVPIGRGGLSTRGNTVVCCKTCNYEKGHRTAAELKMESSYFSNSDHLA